MRGAIVVNFTIPKKYRQKHILITGFIVITLLVSLVAGLVIRQYILAKNTNDMGMSNRSFNDLEYSTVLPSNKSIDDLGGWQRISPPESEPVYAYNDAISGIPVSVSQQPLPPSLTRNTDDQVAELAKKFNATTQINSNGTTLYVGSSAKGPQSAIFTKNGLLILIKSENKIDDKAWAQYTTSLTANTLRY